MYNILTTNAIDEHRSKLPEIQRYELFHWGEINPLRTTRNSPLFNDRTLWFAYGRQALKVGLQSLGLSAGDEVLVPDYICNVIESAFWDLNITISYYNVREDTTPDFKDIEKKIDSKTKALMAVNYYGIPGPIKTIKDFCTSHRLFFIEDNAQGFLSKKDGQPLGTFGDISFTSIRKSIPIIHGAILTFHPNLQRVTLPLPRQEFKDRKSSMKYFIYYLIRVLSNLKIPLLNQFRRHRRKKKLTLWGNAFPELPDRFMEIRLNPFVPIIVRSLDVDTIIRNKRKKYERVLAFLRDQALFSGEIFLKPLSQETVPFQVPFLLKDKKIDKNKLLTYLNQNGVEAFYWPDLPQRVVSKPNLYPIANYLKDNLIHFPV